MFTIQITHILTLWSVICCRHENHLQQKTTSFIGRMAFFSARWTTLPHRAALNTLFRNDVLKRISKSLAWLRKRLSNSDKVINSTRDETVVHVQELSHLNGNYSFIAEVTTYFTSCSPRQLTAQFCRSYAKSSSTKRWPVVPYKSEQP